MIIRFGLKMDRLLPAKPQSSLGRVTAGPGALLSILESQLGQPGSSVPPATRLVHYRACLSKCDSAKRFYHASFQEDDLSVARALLNWRDEWYMAGWNGAFSKNAGRRLNDVADVEKLAVQEVADKNFLFCVGSIGKLALCVKRKCVATYSVSGLWDGGCGFEYSEKAMIGTFQADMG